MAVTLCIPPRAGELCAPVRFLLRTDSVVMELTARHRITGVVRRDEHVVAVNATNPAQCTPQMRCSHQHGPNCGHEAVPHGDHVDYLIDGHLHHPHGDHCDDHGPVQRA